MDRNRVTVRYAKALIELASEQKVLDHISRDSAVMLAALSEYKGFADFITNPGFSPSEKYKKVQSIFAPDFHPLSIKFFKLVFDHNREEYLKDLCRNIVNMSREMSGIITANLTTAAAIESKLTQQVKTKFEQKIKATLEMTTEVNPELIGGFVFTIDGQQYDASVATKLEAIKKQLQLK
ncbi:MAG: ATP synthase F1 subunit delta [Prolixibacteraceae bacterium]